MQYLEVNKNIFFKCSYHGRYKNTERAILMVNDVDLSQGSYHWENRPWQSYDFDIAMTKAFNSSKNRLSKHQQRVIKKWLDNGGKREAKQFSHISAVMAMGELFTNNQTEANDWKARMLKAGLEGRGLNMPEDWETLSEDEKQHRLDGVAKILAQ